MNLDGPAISHMRRPQPREHVTRSPCYDDLRFITHEPAAQREAIAICKSCTDRVCRPVLRDILSSPTARSVLEGVWDGKGYSQNTTGKGKRPRGAV
jgi:hypothetical protein